MYTIGNCERDTCVLIHNRTVSTVSLAALRYDFRCAACDGMLELRPVIENGVAFEYDVICHRCETVVTEVKHTGEIRREVIATALILDGLPSHLAALIKPQSFAEVVAIGTRLNSD